MADAVSTSATRVPAMPSVPVNPTHVALSDVEETGSLLFIRRFDRRSVLGLAMRIPRSFSRDTVSELKFEGGQRAVCPEQARRPPKMLSAGTGPPEPFHRS